MIRRYQMLDKVIEILGKYTEAKIEDESRFTDDLMLTSLDVISIIGDIEDEFDIEISDEDVLGMITVGDLVKYLEDHAG
jgi:acyl carrier protein